MAKDTTLKKADPKEKGHPAKEKVEKPVEIRKERSMEEYQRMVDEENGKVTEVKTEEKVDEVKPEPKSEIKPEVKEGEKVETVLPDRYKGKTPEELVKILDEKEKYIQERSGTIGDLREKIKDTEILKAKVDEIEASAIKQTQQPGNVPKPPEEPVITDDEFYNDPSKAYKKILGYNKKLLEYTQQYTNAVVSPFYQTNMERKRDKLYQGLEEKYKNYPVIFDKKKIQGFLDKNPDYFTKYGVNAYEKAYHDVSVKDFADNKTKNDEAIREQIKKEVLEEIGTKNQAGSVGLGDLSNQPINPTGKAPEYDKQRMEDDAEYRDEVLADMEKRGK